jgi:hypothetical protein
MYKIIALVAVTLFCAAFVRFEPPYSKDGCSIENISFSSGEKLVYKAYYNWKFIWIPAGEAAFTVTENKFDYEIKVIGKTYESYDNFFRVRDYFFSKIDKRTMYPKMFVRRIEEGDYRKYDSIIFDQNAQKVVSYNGKYKSTASKKDFTLKDCTHDLLSVLYYMRNINVDAYKKGEYIPTAVFFDEELFPVKVRYDGKEKKKDVKELGKYNTIKVIPDLVVGNVFKEGDKMKIWVTDDSNKLPLLVESPLKIGSAKAILKSHSGLRYDVTSKVK